MVSSIHYEACEAPGQDEKGEHEGGEEPLDPPRVVDVHVLGGGVHGVPRHVDDPVRHRLGVGNNTLLWGTGNNQQDICKKKKTGKKNEGS